MIKHSRGNAAKDTVRCPHCAFENLPQYGTKQGLISMECWHCGQIIVVNRKEWDRLGWQLQS